MGGPRSLCICTPAGTWNSCLYHCPFEGHTSVAERGYKGCNNEKIFCGPGATDCAAVKAEWEIQKAKPQPFDGNMFTYEYTICCIDNAMKGIEPQDTGCGDAPLCQQMYPGMS